MSITDAIPEKKKREALIRYEMNLKNLTGAEIARQAGIKSRVCVNREIQGAHRSRHLRERIAKAIGKPYREVWGEE